MGDKRKRSHGSQGFRKLLAGSSGSDGQRWPIHTSPDPTIADLFRRDTTRSQSTANRLSWGHQQPGYSQIIPFTYNPDLSQRHMFRQTLSSTTQPSNSNIRRPYSRSLSLANAQQIDLDTNESDHAFVASPPPHEHALLMPPHPAVSPLEAPDPHKLRHVPRRWWDWYLRNETPGVAGELTMGGPDVSEQHITESYRYLLQNAGFHIEWNHSLGSGACSEGVYPGRYEPEINRCFDINNQYIKDTHIGQRFAAKYVLIKEGDVMNSDCHESEKQIMKVISHRNVVRLRMAINLGTKRSVIADDGFTHLYDTYPAMLLVMDLAEYGSIECFQSNPIFNNQLVFDTVFCDLCEGLQYLHNTGIRHGDMNTGNAVVFLEAIEAGVVAKWMDFGLSSAREGAVAGHRRPVSADVFAEEVRRELRSFSAMFEELINEMTTNYNNISIPFVVDLTVWRDVINQLMVVNTIDEIIKIIQQRIPNYYNQAD